MRLPSSNVSLFQIIERGLVLIITVLVAVIALREHDAGLKAESSVLASDKDEIQEAQ